MAATLQLTAKEDVTKTLFKLEQQNLRLIAQNKRLARASGRATREAKGGFDGVANSAQGVVGSLARMAAGYFSVRTGITAVTAAMKDLEEQQRRSRDATVTQADAQMNMLRNLGNVSDAEQARFLGELKNLALKTAPQGGLATVYNMAAAGLSASGANRQKTLDAIAVSLQFAPESTGTATEITGALIDMAKVTGRQNMLENLGFLKIAGEQSRVVEWGNIARNLPPGMVGATAYGATPQEAGALTAAVTQRSSDPEGRKSATAVVRFTKQLDEFLPTEDVYGQVSIPGRRGKVRGLVTKGTGLKTLTERLQYLREHPLKMEELLRPGGMEIPAKQETAIREIIQGPSTTGYKMYAKSLAAFNITYAKMAEQGRAKIQQMKRQFEQQIAGGKRGTDVRGELASTQTPSGRTRSIQASFTSDELDKMLADRGVDWLRRKTEVMAYRIARPVMGSEQAFSDAARRVARRYRFKGESEAAENIEADLTARTSRAAAQREEAKRLDSDVLKQIAENTQRTQESVQRIEENTRRTGEGTDQIEKNTRGPAPVAVQENVTQHGER